MLDDSPYQILKFLFSGLILVGGLACALFYLRKPSASPDRPGSRPAVPAWSTAPRPWRRVGAGICLVLSVMFVLGVYAVDVPDRPRVYATYWLVMMGLVLWLCWVATKDVLFTRRLVARWREQRDDRNCPEEAEEGNIGEH